MDNYAKILRRVARVLLTVSHMTGWESIGVAVAGQIVIAIVAAVLRGRRDLRRAAQGTPEIEHAGRLFAQVCVIHQRGRMSLSAWRRWLRLVEPRYFVDPYLMDLAQPAGGKICKTEGPALKAIEPPKVEDPAA